MTDEPVPLSDREVADRAGVPVERIRELGDIGILGRVDPRGERTYSSVDVMRVEVVAATESAGVSLADLAEAIHDGRLSLDYLDVLPQPARLRSETGLELAAAMGVPFEVVGGLFASLGLPLPQPEARVREDDAFVYEAAAAFLEVGTPPEVLFDAGRIYGESLRRLAQYQVDLFHTRFEEPLRRAGVPEADLLRTAIDAIATRTSRIGTTLVGYLYDRHSESYQVQHRVEHAERTLEAAGMHRRTETSVPAIVFLDLTGYTALTEQRGDEVSAEVALRLATYVDEPVRRHGGHVVKWLGDGVELYFPGPMAAVGCAVELAEGTAAADLPPAHVGINAGPLVFRGGDYYGRTVNVAARLAGVAGPGEVVVAGTVVDAGAPEGVRYAPMGSARLKGVTDPVALHRAEPEGRDGPTS